MRKIFLAAGVAAGMAMTAVSAHATEFAGTWTLTELGTTGLGLDVNATKTTGAFDIKDGVLTALHPTKSINLFDLYTTETSLQSDDTDQPLDIQLTFTFTTPTPTTGGVIGGTTVGESNPLDLGFFSIQGFYQNGELTWADNGVTDVNFGSNLTGLLTIKVNGGSFDSGILGLDGGSKNGLDVKAKFDWVNDPTAGVPEPASWALMIGGFGLAGATLRRRRASAVTA